MTKRDKWKLFLSGENVGTMVSPLCDKWGADTPYKWTLDFEEPFKPGECNHVLSQQLMMAKIFDWDPLFLAGICFKPKNHSITPKVQSEKITGKATKITTTIETPYGDLVMIESESYGTRGLVKDFLVTEDDYRKMIWYSKKCMDFDVEDALKQGKKIIEAVGDRGLVGTWFDTAVMFADVQNLFFHAIDFPELFEELYVIKKECLRKRMNIYQEIGFDYLFYVIPGTEWVSPSFFEEWMYDEIKENIAEWKKSGGFTLWHTCGHEKAFLENNYYNELCPAIFETLSEPPVGNIPSLKWGREQLDTKIITKGNISLDLMLTGTPEQIREQVRLVKVATTGYRHIIGLSDNILDNTPVANLRAYVDECRK